MVIECESERCPECGGALIEDQDAGEKVCTQCGLAIRLPPSLEPEWNLYPDRIERIRAGKPISFEIHDLGLSTNIGFVMKDHLGKQIDPEMISTLNRMRMQQRRIGENWARNLRDAIPQIVSLCHKMGLPRYVARSASRNYRILVKKGGVKGRSIEEMVPSIVYLACRICGVVRQLMDFVEETGFSKKTVGKNYRVACKVLEIQPPRHSLLKRISMVVNKMNANRDTEKIAFQIARAFMPTITYKGKSPRVITATIVYVAGVLSGEKFTQGEVAKAASTTEVSLRNRLRDLEETLMFEVKL